MSFDVPILILSFNRPELIYKQLKLLKNLKPSTLYIFSDGPRKNNHSDYSKVYECRKLFQNNINWDCNKIFKFEQSNLGCGLGVSTAISWFFSNISEGLIIEDDCFLAESFFPFAKKMLEIYRNDSSIAGITADFKISSLQTSKYGFISYPLIWGWASWRRSWEGYSLYLKDFDNKKLPKRIRPMPKQQQQYWIYNFKKIQNSKKPHTWDVQFCYLVFARDQNFIHPFTNLISNQGFGLDATHTKNSFDEYSNLKLGIIKAPYELDLETKNYEEYLSHNLFIKKSILLKIVLFIRNLLKNFLSN